jgi:hypothetical protein
MIAQLFFTALLAGILLYAVASYRKAPVIGLLSIAAGLAGLYFVWVPRHASMLATFAGIGRGADLIVYTWVVISLLMLVNLHLRLRQQTEMITELARANALAMAKVTGRVEERGSRSRTARTHERREARKAAAAKSA